jgi:hypothetical protein
MHTSDYPKRHGFRLYNSALHYKQHGDNVAVDNDDIHSQNVCNHSFTSATVKLRLDENGYTHNFLENYNNYAIYLLF